MENASKKNQGEYTVDIVHVLKSIWHRMWLIILVGALAAGASFAYASFVKEPQYSAKVQLMVQNATKAESDKGIEYDLSLTASELSAAQSLVKTYMEILVGDTTMYKVIEKTGVPYSPDQLAGMIKMEAMNETEILRVTVTTGDPYESVAIANCIAEVLPERVETDLDLKPLKLVDQAYVNFNKVSPNVTKSVIEGFVIGALLAVLLVVVLAIIDGSIHDEEYILRTYNYPVLAKVPTLTPGTSAQSESYSASKKKK